MEDPAAGRRERSGGSPRVLAAAAAACLLALLARAPALSLPIEGDAVAHAALARSLATGAGYALDGVAHDRLPPLWPAVLALPVGTGSTPTGAARVAAWLLGGLAAGLTVVVGSRLARGRASAGLLAALAAFHPALALHAGGLDPGPDALALVLVLAAVRLAFSPGALPRRAGLLAAGLSPLARTDALGFAVAALAFARPTPVAGERRGRERAFDAALALGPVIAWTVRTWIVSGGPFGTTWPGSVPSLARAPGNLVTLLGLVLPAAGVGLLWLAIPGGLLSLARARPADAGAVRTALAGTGASLLVACLFGAAAPGGDRSLPFDASSLRMGVLAVPLLLAAGAHGLASASARMRRPLVVAVLAVTAPLGLLLVLGGVQRALPAGPLAAARLHLAAEAYDAAVAEAGADGWIATDLLPRATEGLEVLIGDRAPGRRSGVVAAASAWPRGAFPRPPVLPLVDALPRDGHVILVSDRDLAGPIYTGDRPEAHVGGQGIFHRAVLREIGGGRAGVLRLHSVRRPR